MATLTEPGVQITTEYLSTSVTIHKPLLKGCIIGPCKQLVDVVSSDGSINSNALAGYYEGSAKTFEYPSIFSYAEPITSSVKVYFRFGNNSTLTELDSSEFAVSTLAVTVSGGAQGVDSTDNKKVDVYIQYEALRKDVAASSEQNVNGTKTGIEIENISDVQSYLGPIDVRNPLALAVYTAKQNATNTSIMSIGVDEVSAQALEGTADAYSRALELAESLDVYTLVPLSQSNTVLSLFPTHVTSMSSATGKSERIAVLCPNRPDTSADETQASGSYGRITSANTFETSGDLSNVSTDDVLVVESDATKYTITAISGSEVTVSPSSLDTSVTTDVVWSIYTPGEPLSTKAAIAKAYAAIGTSYANHRVVLWVPDIVEQVVDGIEYQLPGYCGAATVAGQIGEIPPQQPLTNFPIAGIAGLDGSNDYFSPTQLRVMLNGGLYIVVQEGVNTLPKCLWQLSSDVSTIEKRELSITKAVDYFAKLLRLALRPVIGKNVITEKFINFRVSPIVDGICDHAEENGILNSATPKGVEQSSTQPDSLEVTIDAGVPYPCNFINITIQI